MAEKTLKTRIIQKHDTEANWLLATNFTPMNGEIIIYDEDDNHDYKRIKIGNGIDNVNDLDFVVNKEDIPKAVTSWNNLEDKPFYYNKKVLLNKTIENTHYNSDTETIDLVVGEKYNVLFKDMLFRDMICKEDSDGFKYLQDPNFFYIDDRGGAGLQINGGVYKTYTIEVYQEELKKLDDLFLEQSDWNNNDEYSGVYIKNRPFYSVEPVYEDVSGEITVDVNTAWYGSNYYVQMTPGLGEKFRLSLLDVCTVVWDGVEYKDIQVQLFRTGRYPMTAIGNNCYETPLFTTYPFSIGYSSNNFNTELWVCAREAGTHTFQIFLQTVKPELKQLDEKYIPDSIARVEYIDEAINNIDSVTSWNDLEDKPFYDAGDIEEVILDNYTSDAYNNGEYPQCNFIAWEKYNIVWNDVLYEDVPCISGGNYLYFGSDDGNYDNYPFFIVYDNGEYYISSSTEVFTVSISKTVPNVVKLEQKYVPNADWSQNDKNAPGYIKNRPFYEDIKYGAVLFDGTINEEDWTFDGDRYTFTTEGGKAGGFLNMDFIEVVIDGKTYVLETYNIYSNITGIGDQNLETLDFNMIDNQYSGDPELQMTFKTLATRSIKITQVISRGLKQLDTKYISFVTNTTTKTLSWDGNANGLTKHYYDDRFYKISDQVLTEQLVANGGRIVNSFGDIFDFTADDIRIINEGSESSFMNLNHDVYLTTDGIYFYKNDEYSHTVSLEINEFDGFVVETIRSPYINAYTKEESDAKYQPKIVIDWEQNDQSAFDYIKNRTHYKEIGNLETVFEETTVTMNGRATDANDTWYYQNTTYLNGKFIIEENKVYIVTFDGNTYILNPKRDGYSTYIGNSEYVTYEHNPDEDHILFAIDYYNRTGGVMILKTHYIGEHTIKVEVGEYIYHQLDEKYIPDTIARVEDLNNIDLSSYQSKEDDNLTTTEKTVIGAINEVNEKASAQSDWNENDETSSKFIKNRTHYAISNKDYNLEQTKFTLTIPGSNGGYLESLSIPLLKPLTVGTEYIVVWDGVKYPITITSTGSMGSLYWSGAPIEVHSGEPFFVGFGVDNGNSIIAIIMGEGQGDHTIEIYTGQEEVVQLDEKFIPNISIDKLPNISWNNLTDKPFYENISGDVLLEEQDINLNNKSGNGYETSISIVLTVTQGKEYTVIWDGIPYKVIATTNTLGNYYWTGPSNNTGEPFFIGFDTSEIDIFAETQGKHTLAIYDNYNCEVKQLDEKYIPDTNWNNLLDRPFYENISGDILLEKQIVNCSESTGNGYSVYINASLAVIEGNEYTVIWDGIPYKVIAETNSLGNIYWNGSSTNTGEPFFIGVSGSRLYIATENQEEHTLEVYSNYNYELKQLDEKFIPSISTDKLPNISWNNLTDKPFYESISGDVLLEEHTIIISGDNGNGRPFTNYTLLSPLQLTAEKYIVVWDGIPYETVYTGGKLGNLNAYNSQAPDSGEPFFIGVSSSSLHICCAEQGEHTFAICSSNYNYELKQLDEKFIPNISTDKLPNISWNNLSDRPFYETISGDVLLEERTVNFSNPYNSAYIASINASLALTQGNEYTVLWDGVPYTLIFDTQNNCLGNPYLVGGPDSGEPFFISVGENVTVFAESQGEHTFTIYDNYNCEVKQLDSKFIPNISTDKLPDISWNKISDKPFYESITGDILLEEQTVDCSDLYGNGYCTTISRVLSITEGTEYTIIWDGVPYKAIAKTSGSSNDLGNKYIYDGFYGNTGEPFYVSSDTSNIHIYAETQGMHTLVVYSNYSYEVKQLEEKFIPNVNWEKISNKPFYESISGDVLLEEQVINFTSDRIFKELSFIDNTIYTVIWDGVKYECLKEEGKSYIGNFSIVVPSNPDTGEPFFIDTPSIYCKTQGEHTLAIYYNYNCEVKQLDEKFIPNISWNNLTDKPFYENISGDVLLEEQAITISEDNGNGRYFTDLDLTSLVDLKLEEKYIVVWDGIPYETVYTGGALGNVNAYHSQAPDTGEPFFITGGGLHLHIYCAEQGEHTFAIYSSNYSNEVKKLDKKFIPDTSWNDLKDKPFYENISYDVLLKEQTVNCSKSTANGYSTNINASLTVIEGNEYTVIWDGVPYTLTAVGTTLGNIYWNGSSTNTGEPFFIGAGGSRLYIATENQEEHTLEVYSNYNCEVKQLDEKFIPDNIQRITDNNLTTTDKTIVGAINELNSGSGNSIKTQMLLADIDSGIPYIISIKNGKLISYCTCDSISIYQMPTKVEYVEGDEFDPTGMIVVANCKDGSVREITNYTYSSTVFAKGDNTVTITYIENNVEYTTSINVVASIDIDSLLIDYEYTTNDDCTYTITGWKETLNGESSTEMIFPESESIILEKSEDIVEE